MNARVLVRLVASELRGRRLRAMALLLLVVVLAAAALVAGMGTQSRAGELWDRTFAEAHGAHVTIDSSERKVLRAIASDPRVDEASSPYRALEGDLEIRAGGQRESLLVREMGRDAIPPIARPLLRDGRWAAPGAADEIVIDRAYGLDRGIGVGDAVVVRQAGRDVPFTVVGRAVDLIDCFYPLCDPIPAWLDPTAFARLSTTDAYDAVFLRLHDQDAVGAFVTDIENRYGDRAGSNDWIDTRDDSIIVSGFFGAFLSGFGIFVMIAAALVVLGSMASRVVARRRDIGLLKAVGVTPRLVTSSILVAHVVVAAVGVLVGWVLGSLLSGRLQLALGKILDDDGPSFSVARLVLAFVVVELIVVASIVAPAWRTGRLSTTAALAPAGASRSRRSRLAGMGERLGLGPVASTGVRDAFARPARSVFTVLALAVAIVAVVVSMGFDRTLDQTFADTARTGDPYDVVAAGDDSTATGAKIAKALDANNDVSSWFTTTQRKGVVDDASYLMRALGGDAEHAGYVVEAGRMPRTDTEAIAGYGLLQELGVSQGDSVTVAIAGEPIRFDIVGWYSDTEDTGQVLMFTLDGLRRVEPGATAEAFFAHARDGAPVAAVAAALQHDLAGVAQVTENDGFESDELSAFRTTFLLFTAVVLVVAFANLASALVLAVRERSRDLGVLRSVGFTPRQVLGVSAVGAGTLALLAAVIGLPLGWFGYRALIGTVGKSAGVGPNIGANPAVLALALLVPIAVGAAALLGSAVTRRAATAEVSDLVRYE